MVSPRGGGTVLEAGNTSGDVVALAYSVATGRQKWVKRVGPNTFGRDDVGQMALSPDGGVFYLAGTGYARGQAARSFTAAANVGTGSQAWLQTVTNGAPAPPTRFPFGMVAVSPDGGTVYIGVEGFTTAPHTFSTIALKA